MAKAKPKAEQPEPISEQLTEYKRPSFEALAYYGFHPESYTPNALNGQAGMSGGTAGIQIYKGYKGSPKIEFIYLSHGYFTLGPPGPPKDFKAPIIKLRAKDGHEFLAHLHAAGYPTAAQIKELDKAEELREWAQWDKDCAFAKEFHKPEPPKPKGKRPIIQTPSTDK